MAANTTNGRKISGKMIGAMVLLLLGFILAIGFPAEAWRNRRPKAHVTQKTSLQPRQQPAQKIEKKAEPVHKRAITPIQPAAEEEEEGC